MGSGGARPGAEPHRLRGEGSMFVGHRLGCTFVCDLPGVGVEPVSPALADELSTVGPPGKSCGGT